jgi:hypothetical protein
VEQYRRDGRLNILAAAKRTLPVAVVIDRKIARSRIERNLFQPRGAAHLRPQRPLAGREPVTDCRHGRSEGDGAHGEPCGPPAARGPHYPNLRARIAKGKLDANLAGLCNVEPIVVSTTRHRKAPGMQVIVKTGMDRTFACDIQSGLE